MPKRAYRHPIQIEENQPTETGPRPAANWVPVQIGLWASIEPISASEVFRNGQNIAEATHVVRMRYWPDLNAKHRIKFGSRYLGIVSIINEGELNRYHELICKEER